MPEDVAGLLHFYAEVLASTHLLRGIATQSDRDRKLAVDPELSVHALCHECSISAGID